MAVAALLFELGMPDDNRPRRHKLLEEVLRPREGHHGACHDDRDHERMCEVPAQQANPCLEKMRRIDVNDGHDHEQNKQGQVKDVPQAEQALVDGKGRRPFDGIHMLRHEIRHAGELLAPNLLRPPAPPAFDRDHLTRIVDQPLANDRPAPVDVRQPDKPGENAIRGAGTKQRKGVQLRDHDVGVLCIRTEKSPQLIGVGGHLPRFCLASVEPHVDLAVEIPSNDAAYRHNKHCYEGDAAVDRAELEVCMPHDQHRPGDAKDHVGVKPEGDRTNGPQ